MRFSTARVVFIGVVGFGLAAVFFVAGIWLSASKARVSSAPELLQNALRLAYLNNWPEAEPEFRRAQAVFRNKRDRRGVLYAQLGIIRATVQRRNLSDTVAQLDGALATEPLLKTDREMRMFYFIIRGDLDGEMKSRAMRKDWEEVARLAKDLGDAEWHTYEQTDRERLHNG